MHLPDDDPVYTLKKVMKEMDFSDLTARYSTKGRTGYNPIMMYAIVTYANMLGIKSVDRIVELWERDLAFIRLAKGQKPKRDAFYDFIDGTKIEANANRYTFVWRGSINYHLAGLLDTIDSLYKKYNEFITQNSLKNGYLPTTPLWIVPQLSSRSMRNISHPLFDGWYGLC